MTERTGRCQCGSTHYVVTGTPNMLVVCHCTDCQKQSGSAFGLVMVVDEADFKLTKGRVNSFKGISDAGREKTGAFCPDCGTRIYHLVAARPGKVSVRAGTLDDTSTLVPDVHIWTQSKQPWVIIPDGVKTVAGQPG